MTDRNRVFRAAGYVFVQSDTSGPERTPSLEMYRESATGDRRYFVTRAPCAPGRSERHAQTGRRCRTFRRRTPRGRQGR